MPTSNQFKSLRHGGIHTVASRGMGRSGRYDASEDIPTPNIEAYGHQPFTEQRLQQPEWPRGTLNIYGLEGLLTALLVLPLGIQPGAWVPLIWNGLGWKIPAVLQDAERYQEFIELIASFLRSIDIGLLETTPRFISVIDTLAAQHQPKTTNAYQDWMQGFGLAVSHSNYLNSTPDPIIRQALHVIGTQASTQPHHNQRSSKTAPSKLQQAVLVLSQHRLSRGPLGSLSIAMKSAAKDVVISEAEKSLSR